MAKLNEKILFVDDDENVLIGYKRQLRKRADIYTALSGEEGLKIIKEHGPFAVVISDMRMPNMNGAQFLTHVKECEPDATRIILTGQADIESAVEAINNGQIFRFLTKPCPPPVMAESLLGGIKQYRLLIAERELLEQTLTGSIKVLTELLSLSNPIAFGQSTRIKHFVKHLISSLGVENSWDIEMASMLSSIGYITLSEDLLHSLASGKELTAEENRLVEESTDISVKLLKNIPRLGSVIDIIEAQYDNFKLDKPVSRLDENERIKLGGHMLKVAKYVDRQYECSHDFDAIISLAKKKNGHFDPIVIEQIRTISPLKKDHTQLLKVSQLTPGMIIEDDVLHNNGMLLLSKGHEVTEAVLSRLSQYSRNDAVTEPLRVTIKTADCAS